MEVVRLRTAEEIEPHHIEAEQMVLGAMMLDQGLIGVMHREGGENLFFDPVHARIYEVAARKDRDGELVSPVTLAENLRESLVDLGGSRYLARLCGSATLSTARDYIGVLADLRAKRDLVTAMSEARAAINAGEDNAGTIAARLEAALIGAQTNERANGPVSMLKAVGIALDQIRAAYVGEEEHFVRSGIRGLDQKISGFYPGELTLIGGRPSMGKTGVALSIALNAARAGHGVVIASLEMNPEAMAIRALSEATAQRGKAVSYSNMRKGDMTEEQADTLRGVASDVASLPITYLPRSYADIGALFAGAKQAKRVMGDNMRLLIVDYAQLLKSQARTRYEQITEISIALKALAGHLNVPVIALSQLSRAVEQRDDKRPILSDLRESGQLEQDADAIMFCYRDEYYLEREQPDIDDLDAYADWQAAMSKAQNHLEIIVAKQRQGEIGTVHCRFNPALNLIWED